MDHDVQKQALGTRKCDFLDVVLPTAAHALLRRKFLIIVIVVVKRTGFNTSRNFANRIENASFALARFTMISLGHTAVKYSLVGF